MARRRFDAVLALAAALVASLAAGCSSGAATGEAAQPIINGVVDDGDPAVVLLALAAPNSAPRPLCTGEIVSPHVVLTAAHCMAPLTVGVDPPIVIFTGTVLDATATPDQFLAVATLHYLPTFVYNPDTGGDADDLGVLILRDATTIAPVPFNHFALTRGFDGRPGRVVGYGLTSASDHALITAGTRRQAPTSLWAVNEDDTLSLYDGDHSICYGDSGGPALFMFDGSEAIAGISREVYIGCPADKGATDTRTDSWVDFVDGYIAQFDGPLPPGGGPCTTNADCAPYLCADTSAGRICERPCDRAAASSTCAAGSVCRTLDGKTMCAPPAAGCSVGGSSGGLVWLALLLLVVSAYRQVRRRMLTTEHADTSRAARDRPLPEV